MTTKQALDARAFVPAMTRDELQEAVATLNHTANRRIARAIDNPWTRTAPAMSGRFDPKHGTPIFFGTTRGKTLNELRHEYIEVSDFLQSKTSSAAGARAYYRKQEKILGRKITTPAELSQFWREYKKGREETPFLGAPENIDTNEAASAIVEIAVKSGTDILSATKSVYQFLNRRAQQGLPHTREELIAAGLGEQIAAVDARREQLRGGGAVRVY